MINKAQAQYEMSDGVQQCANCVMFKSGSCDLVLGMIEPFAVCAYWESDPGMVTSVGQHLAERGQGSDVPTRL